MQKTSGTLIHSRSREAGFMLQLQLRKKNLVENRTSRHIHVFRTDNGKEFDSYKYDELCWASGIKRELIVPYNPQHNGVAERKDITIC